MTSQHDSNGRTQTSVGQQLQHLLEQAYRAGEHLVRQGNRRRLTLRDRGGEVWIRLPLTLAVIVTLLLLPAWPLLVVLVVVGFAIGAQLSVERHEPDQGVTAPPAVAQDDTPRA